MPKIILSLGDAMLREVVLSKERTTIGRRPSNDIVIDSLAISGEHAVIVTQDKDSFLEDQNSTNGTMVNGQPVKLHFLQDGDVIELAQYRMRYVVDNNLNPNNAVLSLAKVAASTRPSTVPTIRILNGQKAGREILLDKPLITLGRANVSVVVVTQNGNDYYLNHVEGGEDLTINGKPLNTRSHRVLNGDVLELSGVAMEFVLWGN